MKKYKKVHSGIKRGYIQVHSGTFRSIQDFSVAVALNGGLGNIGKREYTRVNSVQPPQPYIILRGGRGNREGGKAYD